MGSFGDRLRRERELRGITLDDIALTTKIRAGLLQALEEEKFDRLPGGIFNKGFVRAYARHLGLDEDQAVADYLAASGEGPIRRLADSASGVRGELVEPRIQLVRDETEGESEAVGAQGVRGVLAGLLLLVVVGAVAWFYYHRERRADNGLSSETAATPSPSNLAPRNPAAGVSSNPAENNAAPTQVNSEHKSGGQEGPPPAGGSAAASAPATTVPTGFFTVRLKADEECWVQITADGKSEEITLEAGLEKTITAKNRVTIRAGSVGALDIAFDGKKLPAQGEYGQVKTLVFGPGGLQSATLRPAEAPSTVNP
jgi:cytoskeleton protein RodZ